MRQFIVHLAVRNADGSKLDEGFFEETKLVAEELAKLDVLDPFVDSDIEGGKVLIGLDVKVADEFKAAGKALSLVRTAIHAAGGATPGWEHGEWKLLMVETTDSSEDDGSKLVEA